MTVPPPPPDPLAAQAAAVRRLSGALVYDPGLAEDVAQEALWIAQRRPAPPGRSFAGWLAGIVRGVARNALRGRRRRQVHELEAARRRAGVATDDPAAHLSRLEEGRRALDALHGLPEPLRRTLCLRYLEDSPVAEVARATGVPLETARARLRAGLQRLRATLGLPPAREPDRRRSRLTLAAPAALRGLPWFGGGLSMKTLAVGAVVLLLMLGAAGLALIDREARTPPPPVPPAPEAAPAPRAPALEGAEVVADPRRADPVEPRVSGRVLEAVSERPVAGARLSLVTLGGEQRTLAEARSGDDGAFDLAFPGTQPLALLVAEAPEQAPAVAAVRAGQRLDLRLGPLSPLRGRVRDLDDRPVAGARLAWRATWQGAALVRSTTSGPDGAFELGVPSPSGLPAFALAELLEVRAEGFAPLRVPLARVDRRREGRPLDVLLLRGASLTGCVRAEGSGAPLPGARVVLWGETEVSPEPGFDGSTPREGGPAWFLGETRTDADGRYRFDGLPAWTGWPLGVWIGSRELLRLGWVAAFAPGHAPARRDVSVADDGQSLALDLGLPAAGAVLGRVVDPSGAPVEGAGVSWAWLDGRPAVPVDAVVPEAPRAWVRTGADGRFRLEAVAAADALAQGRARLSVAGPGPVGAGRRSGRLVAPPPGAELDAGDLVLPPEGPPADPSVAVQLRVEDERGAPLGGARLGDQPSPVLSDARGRLVCVLEPVAGGGLPPLTVASPGYRSRVVPLPTPLPAGPVVVRLEPGEDPPPTVTLPPRPAEPPAAETRVEVGVELVEQGTGRPVLRSRLEVLGEAGEATEARALGAGRFEVSTPAEGRWRLRARARGYETLEQPLEARGAPTAPLRLTLVRAPGLRLRALDAAGRPFADGRLWAAGAGRSALAELDGQGRATLEGLRAGESYELTCSRAPSEGPAQWFVPQPYGELTPPSDGSELTVVLQPAAAVTVGVQGPRLGHEALPDAAAARVREGTEATLRDASGRVCWRRRHLRGSGWSVVAPPGEYVLTVTVPGADPVERALHLVLGAFPRLDLEIP